MNWITRGATTFSSPYKIVSTTRGYEAWLFSKKTSGVLGREITTLDKAKAVCEKHAATEGR